MNHQDIFAKRLAAKLNEGLDDIPQHVQARLNQARFMALQKRRPQTSLVGQALLALHLDQFKSKTMMLLLAALIALTTLGAIQYVQIQMSADEAADIDEEILADDAPVQSYTDPAFSLVFRAGLLKKD